MFVSKKQLLYSKLSTFNFQNQDFFSQATEVAMLGPWRLLRALTCRLIPPITQLPRIVRDSKVKVSIFESNQVSASVFFIVCTIG